MFLLSLNIFKYHLFESICSWIRKLSLERKLLLLESGLRVYLVARMKRMKLRVTEVDLTMNPMNLSRYINPKYCCINLHCLHVSRLCVITVSSIIVYSLRYFTISVIPSNYIYAKMAMPDSKRCQLF